MKKSILIAAGLAAALMATGAWAGNAFICLRVVSADNISGRALENMCDHPVEATWCYGYGCSYDNSWTIQPHQKMPLESAENSNAYVSYDGCDGANSIKSSRNGRLECSR